MSNRLEGILSNIPNTNTNIEKDEPIGETKLMKDICKISDRLAGKPLSTMELQHQLLRICHVIYDNQYSMLVKKRERDRGKK